MKKLLIFALIGTLIFQPVLIKAETAENITEKLSGETLDAVFEDMKKNLKNGEEVSFSASLDKAGGLYISPDLKYNLSDCKIDTNNLDASLTNLGFSQLTASLAGSFNNIDLSGSASGCVELFNSQFGDLSLALDEDEYEMPNDFNVNDILNSSKNNINQAYADAINTESFQAVKNSISIGNIFEAAQQGVKKHSLNSSSSLQSQLPGRKDFLQFKEYKEAENQLNILIHPDGTGLYQKKLENAYNMDSNYIAWTSYVNGLYQENQEKNNDDDDNKDNADSEGLNAIELYTNAAGDTIDLSIANNSDNPMAAKAGLTFGHYMTGIGKELDIGGKIAKLFK